MNLTLKTENLILKSPEICFATNLKDYYIRNKDFLEQFEPKRSEDFFTEAYQQQILQKEILQLNKKQAYRFYIFKKDEPQKIIGIVGLNNVVWGCFLSCFLGYKLDCKNLNRGYMTECINAVTKFAFEKIGLHRIEGNVMPKNKASLKVLEKCGFKNEGVSEKYLKINGIWEDHIHMVKLNEKNKL